MAKWPKSTALMVTATALVTSHPAWLHGLIITSTAAGDPVTVYEGQDADSGRAIAHLHGPVNTTFQATFEPPIWCQRGIYVTLGSSIDHACVHYTPQSLNQPEGE